MPFLVLLGTVNIIHDFFYRSDRNLAFSDWIGCFFNDILTMTFIQYITKIVKMKFVSLTLERILFLTLVVLSFPCQF